MDGQVSPAIHSSLSPFALFAGLPVAVSTPVKDLQMKAAPMGVEQAEHTCKGRTGSRDTLSLLVSSHRSHYKESPGDRMVSSTEHPRGAPIRSIPLVQREGEAPAASSSHQMCHGGSCRRGGGAETWPPLPRMGHAGSRAALHSLKGSAM